MGTIVFHATVPVTQRQTLSFIINVFVLACTDDDRLAAKKQATDQAKQIKLNVVRLMFQGYLMDVNGGFTRMINPVLTRPIYDSSECFL